MLRLSATARRLAAPLRSLSVSATGKQGMAESLAPEGREWVPSAIVVVVGSLLTVLTIGTRGGPFGTAMGQKIALRRDKAFVEEVRKRRQAEES